MGQLVPAAEVVGVRLAFETYVRQLTDILAGTQQLLELAKSSVVGLTVDFSNLSSAGENLHEAIPALARRMYNTHLKNGVVGEDGGWQFKSLDDGLTNYSEVFPLLRDIDYNGYLAIECLSPAAKQDPSGTARKDLDILRRYLQQAGLLP